MEIGKLDDKSITQKKRLEIRLDQKQLEYIKKIADRDGDSLAKVIRHLINRERAKNGY